MAEDSRHDGGASRSRVNLVLFAFAVIGAFFLVAEHRAHVLQWLPWLFLAACPLMHLFMHRGHDGHDRRDGSGRPAGAARDSPGVGAPGTGGTSRRHHRDRT